jgi:hypothetical protein
MSCATVTAVAASARGRRRRPPLRTLANTAVGNYGVTARCGGGNLGVSATIHVVA